MNDGSWTPHNTCKLNIGNLFFKQKSEQYCKTIFFCDVLTTGPSEPTNLQLDDDDNADECRLTWGIPDKPNGDITEYTVSISRLMTYIQCLLCEPKKKIIFHLDV